MVLRPRVSLKLLHHKGKMDMESMYIATLRFVIVGEASRAFDIGSRAGMTIADPIGAADAANATTNVIVHFVLRG